jgi:uncharacterized protein
MPEMSEYPAGTPSWVDLGTPDMDKTVAFYGGLFGWDIPEAENAEQTGGYRTAISNGKTVAGIMPLMQEGQPPVWSSYVNVDDADATAAKVREAGGTVIAEPMDVMDLGRMAVFMDPTGAALGIWQPGTMKGADLVNEPVSLCWNELNTRDTDAAGKFYEAVFGWNADSQDSATGYVVFKRGEDWIAGMMDMARTPVPDSIPPHWLVYFAVDDADAAIEKAKELGGNLAAGPVEIPFGKFAVMTDPNGSAFAVMRLSQEQE